ncbi:MAG: NAD(P)-binding oxidoreductase [Bacteroidota bacterium]
MQILLLGATGRTGKLILEKAPEKGHDVNALFRKSGWIKQRDGLKIFDGNPNERTDLEKAISGCDAIISVLNISRKSDFPWSSLKTPKTYLSNVMALLVSIAEKRHIQRIAVCSAWGVSDTKTEIPKWFKWLIDNSNIGIAHKDHERQEKIIMESNRNWTIARPVGLTNSRRKEKMRETYANIPKPSLLISRQSTANYLIECLSRFDLELKKVVISTPLLPFQKKRLFLE